LNQWNWRSVRISQPAASNSGTCSGATKVAWAEERSWLRTTISAAAISGAASSASRSSRRGPGTGLNGEAIWSLG
jgi:hypothetical protein